MARLNFYGFEEPEYPGSSANRVSALSDLAHSWMVHGNGHTFNLNNQDDFVRHMQSILDLAYRAGRSDRNDELASILGMAR